MTFKDLLLTITKSSPSDWNVVHDVKEMIGGHFSIATYKPDLSISMAWGIEYRDRFDEPWTSNFSDKNASGDYLDLFYMGTLVDRTVLIFVDGGRAALPMPTTAEDLTVSSGYAALARLVDNLQTRVSQFDRYFKQAGLIEVDAPLIIHRATKH